MFPKLRQIFTKNMLNSKPETNRTPPPPQKKKKQQNKSDTCKTLSNHCRFVAASSVMLINRISVSQC